MKFEDALKHVLKHEGGYVNDPTDMGGETNYGITFKTAKDHGYNGNMKDIPMSVVGEIYKKGYWDRCKCDQLPVEIRYAVFDAAVNHGTGNSAKFLQRSVGAKADGAIGPNTIAKAQSATLESFQRERGDFYIGIIKSKPKQIKFGKGWFRRLNTVSFMK